MVEDSTGHLVLFFDEDWTVRSSMVSYGHDIEASWLLQDSAGVTGDPGWMEKTRQLVLKTARAAADGVHSDGGVWYERGGGRLAPAKHWRPRAGSLIGLFKASERRWVEAWLRPWL